jgi:FkbM family methyltransferase
MTVLRSIARVVPPSIRRTIVRAIDGVVPLRWQLPYICAKLRAQGALDEEIAWLARLIPAGSGTAIDVGANIGIYSYYLARICSRVEAFEPNPACAKVLEAYCAGNIHVHPIALSAERGTAMLNIPVVEGVQQTGLASLKPSAFAESRSIAVQVQMLDEYSFDNVRFVKVDVEGKELDVLAGAERTLRKHRPILLLELEERHQQRPIRAIIEAVAEMGYQCFFLFDGSLQPIRDFDPAYHQRGYWEQVQQTKYVNNFFFLPLGHESVRSSEL